ncbi:amino acid ABC transporter substrate-binding protein [Desulfuromonas sp. TF]|uniref:amino acid ABC transporter substrate-binding protein n=1 Tax=Desulfuromonas sp. TF TaxID=1232410 RepID=UPI00040D3246|nr:amino acid ABC transporter substrate-binding protein [Desulfuromonas sp. TF]
MIIFADQFRLGMVIITICMGVFYELPVQASPRSEIVIGTHLPLTGERSGAGREQRWAYQEAVKDINALGGIFVKEYGKKLPVRLIIEDDKSNTDNVVRIVERLIKFNNVDMLLSGFSGNESVIPACISAEQHKKYYHASIAFIPTWVPYEFKWSTLFFFDIEQSVSVPFQLWNSMPENQRPKKPAVYMEDTYDGRLFADLFRAVSQRYGYSFAFFEVLPVGANDYSVQIMKAKALGVDAILFFSSEEDSIAFIRQMKQNGLNVGYLHGWKGSWAGNFWKELGKDAQYILCDGFWSMDFPLPGAKDLGERYRKEFGESSVSVGCTYALAQILWQAIEKAGTLDGEKVREAVVNKRFETVMGPVKYHADGVATFVSTANQWIDGKQELVYPFKWAKTTVHLAPPWTER